LPSPQRQRSRRQRPIGLIKYKIELRYSYGWDDAGWTDETVHEFKPTRFEAEASAEAALDEFFAEVKGAMALGNMESEHDLCDYRIAKTND